MKKNTGARWKIAVDGIPRSYRHRKEMAIEGAEYVKSRQPSSEVTVRDYDGIEAAPSSRSGPSSRGRCK